MANIVGIRFKRAGKIYDFDAKDIELKPGDYAVVKTSRGMELGHVVIAPAQVAATESAEALSPVIRKATPEDISKTEELEIKAEEALIACGGHHELSCR
jgi:cell fate regulator YaaT (PSP1 superfamily)